MRRTYARRNAALCDRCAVLTGGALNRGKHQRRAVGQFATALARRRDLVLQVLDDAGRHGVPVVVGAYDNRT